MCARVNCDQIHSVTGLAGRPQTSSGQALKVWSSNQQNEFAAGQSRAAALNDFIRYKNLAVSYLTPRIIAEPKNENTKDGRSNRQFDGGYRGNGEGHNRSPSLLNISPRPTGRLQRVSTEQHQTLVDSVLPHLFNTCSSRR